MYTLGWHYLKAQNDSALAVLFLPGAICHVQKFWRTPIWGMQVLALCDEISFVPSLLFLLCRRARQVIAVANKEGLVPNPLPPSPLRSLRRLRRLWSPLRRGPPPGGGGRRVEGSKPSKGASRASQAFEGASKGFEALQRNFKGFKALKGAWRGLEGGLKGAWRGASRASKGGSVAGPGASLCRSHIYKNLPRLYYPFLKPTHGRRTFPQASPRNAF